MKKIKCRCGDEISLSEIPVEGEFVWFSGDVWDATVDALVDAVLSVDAREKVLLGEAISDALAVRVSHFYRCRKCGRLILSKRGEQGLEFFRLEDS